MEGQTPIIRIHGPYEDAIIAGFEFGKVMVEGMDPSTRAECWKRPLELTAPLHNLALEAAKNIEKFVRQAT